VWLWKLEATFQRGSFEKNVACDAKAWREGDRRRETASGNEVGVGKESCERPKPSSSSDVSFERRRRKAASRRAVEENQSSV
jgi:hypothetical protein